MPKKTPNIMRVSGWLPVSYSVYQEFEKKLGENCYGMAKVATDRLDDNPKSNNKKILKQFANNFFLDDRHIIIEEEAYLFVINSLIDFIRDSLIIYRDTIKEEAKVCF